MKCRLLTVLTTVFLFAYAAAGAQNILVFQSDFGLQDGAVAAMKGVAVSVSADLKLYDLTHDITPFNIYEAAYRLEQVARYWPVGTVFVSVVDPGVGSSRKSIVMKTRSGHYFVSPDNGTLTMVGKSLGLAEVREIDESRNRLAGSSASYTFHGRDVYAYTAARLAARVISFEEAGPVLTSGIVSLSISSPQYQEGQVTGMIPVLDVQYGNVWTNIDQAALDKLGIKPGDPVHVKILERDIVRYEGKVLFGKTFADVRVGEAVAYQNSLMNFSLGINQGNFAGRYAIGTGDVWHIVIRKAAR
ncbi:MAG TPA: S-adenosyl-l-methionine hydroxide adenosyltransferase family protein [Ohtaekwangia sp.]|nr:S-adenosyl-l-methionine hydroxide adenosyltransferase family protein [Ohtaekwangia sp.]